jgi:hypothetical protein
VPFLSIYVSRLVGRGGVFNRGYAGLVFDGNQKIQPYVAQQLICNDSESFSRHTVQDCFQLQLFGLDMKNLHVKIMSGHRIQYFSVNIKFVQETQ